MLNDTRFYRHVLLFSFSRLSDCGYGFTLKDFFENGVNAWLVGRAFAATVRMKVYSQIVDVTEFEIVPSHAQSLSIFDVSNPHHRTVLFLNLKHGRA